MIVCYDSSYTLSDMVWIELVLNNMLRVVAKLTWWMHDRDQILYLTLYMICMETGSPCVSCSSAPRQDGKVSHRSPDRGALAVLASV